MTQGMPRDFIHELCLKYKSVSLYYDMFRADFGPLGQEIYVHNLKKSYKNVLFYDFDQNDKNSSVAEMHLGLSHNIKYKVSKSLRDVCFYTSKKTSEEDARSIIFFDALMGLLALPSKTENRHGVTLLFDLNDKDKAAGT